MRIIITDIRAKILDVCTQSEDNFILECWIVSYHISFSSVDNISGAIEWTAVPNMYKILKFLHQRYDKVSPHN